MVGESLDPLQFAYKSKRSIEDAGMTLLDTVIRHLDSFVRILFLDLSLHLIQWTSTLFCAASNSCKWTQLWHWIKELLKDRPQHVRVKGFKSTNTILNTGLPQGCVLSPVLFSIYTNEITCSSNGLKLFKYADDMALVANLTDLQAVCQHTSSMYFGWREAHWSSTSPRPRNCVAVGADCLILVIHYPHHWDWKGK